MWLVKGSGPNIVQFIGISFHEGAIMILQEYCHMHLGEYIIQKGPFKEVKPFLDLFLTLLDTLAFLHEKNIVHLDLKPANILLDKSFVPKICDLGMAKFLTSDGDLSYRTNDWHAGTPGYMPPEMINIRKGGHYSPKYWDVFSMAMVTYFLWTGKTPLSEYENAFIINDEISKGTRPLLPTSMPPQIRELTRKMWDQRYQERPSIYEVSMILSGYFQEYETDNNLQHLSHQRNSAPEDDLFSNEEDFSNSLQLSSLADSLLSK